MTRAPLFRDVRPAMGTDFEIWLEADDAQRASELFEVAFEQIERLDATLSTYRATSELSRINRGAGGPGVTTDRETFELLSRSRAYGARSGGAFDVTVGSLVRAWGFFRGEGRYPADDELGRAAERTGWRHLELEASSRLVRLRRRGMSIDLGAIAKGFALDRAVDVLREAGVSAALAGAGRSTYVAHGAPNGSAGWRVNVPDPRDRQATISSVVLHDAALSTSGGYEKFFVLGGERYCHILDPRSGRPVSGMLQTTVVGVSGEDSDALATAAFVAGFDRAAEIIGDSPERSLMMIEGNPATARARVVRWPDAEFVGLDKEYER